MAPAVLSHCWDNCNKRKGISTKFLWCASWHLQCFPQIGILTVAKLGLFLVYRLVISYFKIYLFKFLLNFPPYFSTHKLLQSAQTQIPRFSTLSLCIRISIIGRKSDLCIPSPWSAVSYGYMSGILLCMILGVESPKPPQFMPLLDMSMWLYSARMRNWFSET